MNMQKLSFIFVLAVIISLLNIPTAFSESEDEFRDKFEALLEDQYRNLDDKQYNTQRELDSGNDWQQLDEKRNQAYQELDEEMNQAYQELDEEMNQAYQELDEEYQRQTYEINDEEQSSDDLDNGNNIDYDTKYQVVDDEYDEKLLALDVEFEDKQRELDKIYEKKRRTIDEQYAGNYEYVEKRQLIDDEFEERKRVLDDQYEDQRRLTDDEFNDALLEEKVAQQELKVKEKENALQKAIKHIEKLEQKIQGLEKRMQTLLDSIETGEYFGPTDVVVEKKSYSLILGGTATSDINGFESFSADLFIDTLSEGDSSSKFQISGGELNVGDYVYDVVFGKARTMGSDSSTNNMILIGQIMDSAGDTSAIKFALSFEDDFKTMEELENVSFEIVESKSKIVDEWNFAGSGRITILEN